MNSERSPFGGTARSVFRVYGVNRVASEDGELAILDGLYKILLVNDPAPYLVHLFCKMAIIQSIVTSSKNEEREYIENFVSEKNREIKDGVYLVIDSPILIEPDGTGDAFKMFGPFGVHLRSDKIEDNEQHEKLASAALTSIYLTSGEFPDSRIETIGRANYTYQNDVIHYFLRLTAGSISVCHSRPMNSDLAAQAGSYLGKLINQCDFSDIAALLAESQLNGLTKVQSFVTAWAALDLFVNRAYSQSPFPLNGTGRPNFINKFERLNEHFHAGNLNADDLILLRRVYRIRNSFFHEGRYPAEFPMADIYALMWKYLRLALNHVPPGISQMTEGS